MCGSHLPGRHGYCDRLGSSSRLRLLNASIARSVIEQMIESREIRAACPGGLIVFLNRVSLAASFLEHLRAPSAPAGFFQARPSLLQAPRPYLVKPDNFRITAAVVASALFMQNMDGTIVATALPSSARHMN